MAMVGVDSGSLYRRTHSLSRLAWSRVGGRLALFYIEACTGLGLTGNPRVPRVARGFGIRSTGNPRSWVIKYLQSRGVGDDRLRESRGLDLVIS